MMHGWNGAWGQGAYGYGFGFPWGGLIMTVLFITLVAFAVFAAVRIGRSNKSTREDAKERGLEILVERFSRGEIDAETFKTMKAELDARLN